MQRRQRRVGGIAQVSGLQYHERSPPLPRKQSTRAAQVDAFEGAQCRVRGVADDAELTDVSEEREAVPGGDVEAVIVAVVGVVGGGEVL